MPEVYTVGGHDRMYHQFANRLAFAGVNIIGHAEDPREIAIPIRAEHVIIFGDAASHSATDKAKCAARAANKPYVMAFLKSWSRTQRRLQEKGIIHTQQGGSVQTPTAAATTNHTLTQRPFAVLASKLDSPPTTEQNGALSAPAPTPATPDTDTREAREARRDEAILAILKEHDNEILNHEVVEEVKKRFGLHVLSPQVSAVRAANGLAPSKRGALRNLPKAQAARKTKHVKPPDALDALLELVAEQGRKLGMKKAILTWNENGKMDAAVSREEIQVTVVEHCYTVAA